MVTATTITCRKCKVVGHQNFERRIEHLLDAPAVESIICRICSDRLASRPLTTKMKREIPPSESGHLSTLAHPCTVAECPGLINPAKNKSGLCNGCHHKMSNWEKNGSKGLPPFIRTATGYMTRIAFQQLNQEDTHVETISELPRLAPPAPATPAVRHPQSRAPRGRRDSLEGMILFPEENAAELFLLLATIALPTSPDIIAGWSPAERAEVSEWATLIDAIKGRKDIRIVPPMPDVLVPIYDASCTAGRALS